MVCKIVGSNEPTICYNEYMKKEFKKVEMIKLEDLIITEVTEKEKKELLARSKKEINRRKKIEAERRAKEKMEKEYEVKVKKREKEYEKNKKEVFSLLNPQSLGYYQFYIYGNKVETIFSQDGRSGFTKESYVLENEDLYDFMIKYGNLMKTK